MYYFYLHLKIDVFIFQKKFNKKINVLFCKKKIAICFWIRISHFNTPNVPNYLVTLQFFLSVFFFFNFIVVLSSILSQKWSSF